MNILLGYSTGASEYTVFKKKNADLFGPVLPQCLNFRSVTEALVNILLGHSAGASEYIIFKNSF